MKEKSEDQPSASSDFIMGIFKNINPEITFKKSKIHQNYAKEKEKQITKSVNVTKLNIECTEIDFNALKIIIEALNKTPKIKSIKIRFNHLKSKNKKEENNQVLKMFLENLNELQHVTSVDLSGNQIISEELIVTFIEKNSRITNFNLDDNPLTKDPHKILEALETANTSLLFLGSSMSSRTAFKEVLERNRKRPLIQKQLDEILKNIHHKIIILSTNKKADKEISSKYLIKTEEEIEKLTTYLINNKNFIQDREEEIEKTIQDFVMRYYNKTGKTKDDYRIILQLFLLLPRIDDCFSPLFNQCLNRYFLYERKKGDPLLKQADSSTEFSKGTLSLKNFKYLEKPSIDFLQEISSVSIDQKQKILLTKIHDKFFPKKEEVAECLQDKKPEVQKEKIANDNRIFSKQGIERIEDKDLQFEKNSFNWALSFF